MELALGIKQIIALNLHPRVQGVDALLQTLSAMLIGFGVKSPEQKIAAMKQSMGFLVDINQFSADGTGAELGHGQPATTKRASNGASGSVSKSLPVSI